jgi:hypothetical protein
MVPLKCTKVSRAVISKKRRNNLRKNQIEQKDHANLTCQVFFSVFAENGKFG